MLHAYDWGWGGGVRKGHKILLEKSQQKNNLVRLTVGDRISEIIYVKSNNSVITDSIIVKFLWYIHNLQIRPLVA